MTELKRGEILKCPHCGKDEGEQVEDYVVAMSPGRRNMQECGWCYGKFSVTEVAKDTYEVASIQ